MLILNMDLPIQMQLIKWSRSRPFKYYPSIVWDYKFHPIGGYIFYLNIVSYKSTKSKLGWIEFFLSNYNQQKSFTKKITTLKIPDQQNPRGTESQKKRTIGQFYYYIIIINNFTCFRKKISNMVSQI